VGFTIGDDTGMTYDDMKNRIMGDLKRLFRPEFLNRIDEVIVFHKLAKEEIHQIVELLLMRIRASMAERELSLNLSDDAKDLLVEKGWDPSMGARPLRRAIQRYIEDPLADEVLKATDLTAGATVEVDRAESGEGEESEVRISITQPKRQPVTVGGDGESEAEGGAQGTLTEGSGGALPDEPEILPEAPDAPPADEPGPPTES
jgi:ATP-dependent Clp protease ATP-binding subunit ClpC